MAINRAGLYWFDLRLIPSVLALIGLNRPTLAHIGRIGQRYLHKDKGGRDSIKKTASVYSSVMRKRFTQTVLNMVLIAFFIIGFCLGFYLLGLPIMASMYTGAGLAMLPLLMYLRKG